MQIYLVGGALRDELLGLAIKDRDFVVVGATAQDLLAQGYLPVGKSFPVFLHPKTKEEYALARTERKVAAGYHGFTFDTAKTITLEEDLKRRDLTINAIAQDSDGKLIDPFHGIDDLRTRVLRHVSDAFVEDPLRVLRVARFAAQLAQFDFTVAAATLELMQTIVANGEISTLVPERVWLELMKALNSTRPSRFFINLHKAHALKILFPEIANLFGVPQRSDYHPEIDTGVHTLLVLDRAAALTPKTTVRFAALLHDIGKAETDQTIWPKHYRHEYYGVYLTEQLCTRLKAPNDYTKLAMLVTRYHGAVHGIFTCKPRTIYKILHIITGFRKDNILHEFLLACKADSQGRYGYETYDYPQMEFLYNIFMQLIQMDTKPFVAQNLTGAKLGLAIKTARIKMIAKLI